MLKWENMPDFMKNESVKEYYDLLHKKRIQLILKRVFDVICSCILIILLSPILLFIAIWIKLDSKGPVFYRQERVTTYGKVFKIFKFRTMIVDADKIGNLVTEKNDSRITKVGEKIRKYRLDELPQVFNIFLGEMSFVGTRPEVKKYVDEYTDEMKATLLLPAGVTSLASIEFKDEDEIIEKYVQKQKEKILIPNGDSIDINIDIDKIYVEEVLPLKMKYNLDSIRLFNILGEFKVMIDTILKVGK